MGEQRSSVVWSGVDRVVLPASAPVHGLDCPLCPKDAARPALVHAQFNQLL